MLDAFCALFLTLATAPLPSFADYPARVEQIERPKLDLQSHPIGRRYRTVLREAVEKGVTLAGHYALAEWGCGTNCSQFAIVDLRSGRIFHNPNRIMTRGVEIRPNSRLVILNPWTSEVKDFPEVPTQYCVLAGGRLKIVRTVRHGTER